MLATTLLLGGILLASPMDGHAPSATPAPRVTALRVTAVHGAPVLDGRLDDAIWTLAEPIGDFVQVHPRPGETSQFRTVARVAFDDGAVYVGIKAYDPEPEQIMAQLTRRDQESTSDWLQVAFDSYHDRRTAYLFSVNPAGVKLDAAITDDSRVDSGWDAIWEVATRRDEDGWSAEFRIPLSALRFSTEGPGIWGFQVARRVPRVDEQSAWAPFRRDEPRLVSRFGELHGMTGLRAPRRLEVLPYTLSSVQRAPGNPQNPFYSATSWQGAVGVDLKYGVTSNLTLDATFNPDFGQVEADPSQVNVSAYETFLPERRPFFTEGAGIFNFGLSLGDGDNANEQLFYSRRIGRAPQGSADERGGFADAPEQTTILGAAKLSGRTQSGWSIGVLNAVTAQESAPVIDSLGGRYSDVVEPLTNYSVARLRRDLNEGRTQIGAVATGVVRQLDDTELDYLRSSAFAGGVDFTHRFASNHWMAMGSLLGSSVFGSEESILRAQTSPARYFHRPDADHVQVDSSATSLSGFAGSYLVGKLGGRWRGGVGGQFRSPGFEVNDLGYQRDADQILNVGFMGYSQSNPGKLFRSANANFNLWSGRDFDWQDLGVGMNVNGGVQLLNFWRLNAGIGQNLPAFHTRALRGGSSIRTPHSYNGWFGGRSDDRKPLSVGMNGSWRVEEESGSRAYHLSLSPSWRISEGSQLSLSPFYSMNRNGWQYVATRTDDAGEQHYLFGELNQETFGLSARLNQTFTPALSLQLYAQPFVSAGDYSGFKRVEAPHAARYADRFGTFAEGAIQREGDDARTLAVDTDGDRQPDIRFTDPNFNVRDFKLNAVLRWEYRMGSTLFFVWSHGRNSFSPTGDFRARRDFDDLFREPSQNVFLIKANWWLNL
ncbi:MAG: DUF5916 domain-containing protein [Longimicrobiaceae bacterium]